MERLQQLWTMLAALPSFEGLHVWPLIPCKGSYLCAAGRKSQVKIFGDMAWQLLSMEDGDFMAYCRLMQDTRCL